MLDVEQRIDARAARGLRAHQAQRDRDRGTGVGIGDPVNAAIAAEDVVAGATVQGVVARATGQRVIAAQAQQQVDAEIVDAVVGAVEEVIESAALNLFKVAQRLVSLVLPRRAKSWL